MVNLFKFFKKEPTPTVEEIHNDFNTISETYWGNIEKTPENTKEERLSRLGFIQAKGVKEVNDKKRKKRVYDSFQEDIAELKENFPYHKIITEEMLSTLRKKYSFVTGRIGEYVEDVPEKNITEIENFKEHLANLGGNSSFNKIVVQQGFFITAPVTYFNMSRSKVVNGRIVPKDPIVTCAICYKQRDYHIIVTAWGLEASDPEVTNEKMN